MSCHVAKSVSLVSNKHIKTITFKPASQMGAGLINGPS